MKIKRRFLGIGLAVIVVLFMAWRCQENRKAMAHGTTSEFEQIVAVDTLALREAVVTLEAGGTLEASAQVDVVAKVNGMLEHIQVDEGDRVQRDQPLAVIERDDYVLGLEQADAAVAMAEAGLATAESNEKRMNSLFAEGLSSDAAIEGAVAAHDVARAQLAQAKAAKALATRRLDDTTIRAPFDGYVLERLVDTGSTVGQGMPLFTVIATDTLRFQFPLGEQDIIKIKPGTPAIVRVNAFGDRSFDAFVSSVPPGTSLQSAVFRVMLSIPNDKRTLLQGMSARATLPLERRAHAIVVPADVLLQRGGAWTAYVVEDSLAQERPVVPGPEAECGMIVESGLEAGDVLVVEGQTYLRPAQPVRVSGSKQHMEEQG